MDKRVGLHENPPGIVIAKKLDIARRIFEAQFLSNEEFECTFQNVQIVVQGRLYQACIEPFSQNLSNSLLRDVSERSVTTDLTFPRLQMGLGRSVKGLIGPHRFAVKVQCRAERQSLRLS